MKVSNIPINKIDPPAYQPREQTDPKELEELASSIKELGLLQPIVVTPHGERYILVAGSRRLEAARMLGWTSIPASVFSGGERDLALTSLTENVSRVDLHPMETARTIHHLLTHIGLSRVEIASVMGRDVRWVGEQLKLLEMPEYLQEAVEIGALAKSVALELNRIPSEELKEMYTAHAVTGGCTQKTANEWVRQATASLAAKERREELRQEAAEQEVPPPAPPEVPKCWICQAPQDKVVLEAILLCWHCRNALAEK